MDNFQYTRAGSFEEAWEKKDENEGVQYIAGGTNLLDLWKYDLVHFSTLIDINNLPPESIVSKLENGNVLLSARATNADTAYHDLILGEYPLLSKAILAGASPQIRNMATNGGNLLQRTRCYYFYDAASPCNKRVPGSGCPAIKGYNRIHAILGASDQCIAVFPSDMCVALAVLEAMVHLRGRHGERVLKFEDFHRLPGDTPELDNNLKAGEIITAIELPAEGFAKNYSYLKLRDRNSYAFALVSVATGLCLDSGSITKARIALGGVAHIPWRVKEAERYLEGKTPSTQHFEVAAGIILEGAKTYRFNSFKPELARRAIIRNCLMALDPQSQKPGAGPSDDIIKSKDS